MSEGNDSKGNRPHSFENLNLNFTFAMAASTDPINFVVATTDEYELASNAVLLLLYCSLCPNQSVWAPWVVVSREPSFLFEFQLSLLGMFCVLFKFSFRGFFYLFLRARHSFPPRSSIWRGSAPFRRGGSSWTWDPSALTRSTIHSDVWLGKNSTPLAILSLYQASLVSKPFCYDIHSILHSKPLHNPTD